MNARTGQRSKEVGRNKFHRLKMTTIAPTAMRRLAGAVQRNSSPPTGTPMTPPIRNGARRGHMIARRNFHTETPATMGPNTTIKAVTCAGGRKCIHTAVATMANAKPARPLTNAAANAPMANNARWSV